MRAEALALPFEIAFESKIVEAGFTNRDNFRLARLGQKQLDGRLVEVFIEVLQERELAFQHTTDADFENELGFQARVARFARRKAA